MPISPPATQREPKVKSLVKALDVLKCFRPDRTELGVSEISQLIGVQKSTVHNILATLELAGFVEQDPATRRYRLGLQILYLGNVVREGLGLRKAALPVMERARDLFRETVHLTIEQDGQVVYIESLQPADRSVTRLAVGKRALMHCTGVGKAILAFTPETERQSVIARHGLIRYTPNTITTYAALQAELDLTALRGYAVDNMEHEWGIRCVAVPIRDESGRVFASLSVSGPAERLPLENIEAVAGPLMGLAAEISRQMGWQG